VLDLGQYVPYLLNRAGRRVADAFTRELGGFGVTLPMWRVMTSLRSEGPQRLGDLSELTAIEASTLSRLLGQMETKGLVRRARSRGDARAITVSLTPRAAALTGRIVPLALRYEQVALAGMSDAEVAILKRLLTQMHRNLADLMHDKPAG
jgi:DNA-binding MarR family transcriptional regulator